MIIKDESKKTASVASSDGTSEKQATTSKIPSYKVDCIMAWQMDCVACDVMPLDSDHVVVLGLVPLAPDGEGSDTCAKNLVEIQVVNRSNRNIIACDALPLLKDVIRSKETDAHIQTDDARMFSLRSTFCTPRQDDPVEAEDELWQTADTASYTINSIVTDPISSSLVENPSSSEKISKFIDPHMKWSIDQVRRLDYNDNYVSNLEEKIEDETADMNSEFSDDYSFLFRKQVLSIESIAPAMKHDSPMLIIKSHADLVFAETRDIDDAISFARNKGLHGTALHKGLIYRKYLRRHTLRQLVDEFLSALLFAHDDLCEESSKRLLERLQLAARSTAILIGGDVDLWIRWVFEFAKIPGGLFILRPHLPVRGEFWTTKINFLTLQYFLKVF
jgi:hypothetical protein